ncbi:acyl-CoA dehydrogenase family protein [Nonomuraea ceibae]|uniref:acyl-CoA dehydrogenase family protein n=1 Tax=Nonomuraea ceibae TaxID=1935170 RepID=UPI001C5F6ADD|nr:acyl-CoA dehydrogenase family protein [Nonomuraea ceibae]
MTIDPVLLDLMTSVFADRGPTPHGVLDRALWDTLSSCGLTRLTTPEHSGGSGATWTEAAVLLRAAAARGLALPLAENDLLAGWLLTEAGLPSDDILRTACVLEPAGTARGVPWARDAGRIVALWQTGDGWLVADLDPASVHVTRGTNLAGEPRDDVAADLAATRGVPVACHLAEEFVLRGALARALQMTGAMESVLRLCVTHATTRTQFGRPLARFQPVQHLIADIAAETSLARAAADACVREGLTPLSVAVARSCAGHAATTVVRNAHQVHGAMGTTAEHSLHTLTLAILGWRADYGSLHEWDERLTTAAVTAGGELWALIAPV